MSTEAQLHPHTYTYTHTYMYLHLLIHAHTHTHTHTHIRLSVCVFWQPNRRERRFSLLGQNSCDTYIYIYIVDHNRKAGLTASVGRAEASPNKWPRGRKQVLRSSTTSAMTSLLRRLLGSEGQAVEPTRVETVRGILLNCNCTYGKLEKFQE